MSYHLFFHNQLKTHTQIFSFPLKYRAFSVAWNFYIYFFILSSFHLFFFLPFCCCREPYRTNVKANLWWINFVFLLSLNDNKIKKKNPIWLVLYCCSAVSDITAMHSKYSHLFFLLFLLFFIILSLDKPWMTALILLSFNVITFKLKYNLYIYLFFFYLFFFLYLFLNKSDKIFFSICVSHNCDVRVLYCLTWLTVFESKRWEKRWTNFIEVGWGDYFTFSKCLWQCNKMR